jgi:alpha-D-ribose 1-methylphosphonate 5-triphosphate synthase subunit PhnI
VVTKNMARQFRISRSFKDIPGYQEPIKTFKDIKNMTRQLRISRTYIDIPGYQEPKKTF